MPELVLFCPSCHAPLCDGVELVPGTEFCSDCYVNVSCPAQCDLDHDVDNMVPRGARRRLRPGSRAGTWSCPATGEQFRYIGPNDEAGWRNVDNWYEDRWDDGSFLHGDYWYEDESDAGFAYCEGCDRWLDPDSYRWQEGDGYVCRDCVEPEYDDYDDEGECETNRANFGYSAGNQSATDNGEPVTHWHPITEEVFGPTRAATTPGVVPIPSINDLEVAA